MRWPWQWRLRRARDGEPAAAARTEAERKLQDAQRRRDEVRRAAADLASILEQAMRRPR